MGLIEDASNRTRLAKLLRYYTSKSGEKQISLEQYIENMPESQKNIYYISGEDKETLEKSPAVEKLLAKGVEVVYMTDSVDEYALQHLTEYEGKRLINASREGLKMDDESDEDRRREDKYKEMFTPVIDFAKDVLGKNVEKVVVSKHLYKSACTVVSADYGWTAQMEKVMKSQAFADNSKFEFMKSKRILEINPRHPLIIELNKRVSDTPDDESLKDMVNSMYMSSLLQAGYQTTPEEASFFSDAMSRVIGKGLDVAQDAPIADEIEVPEEEEEEAEEEEAEEAEEEESSEEEPAAEEEKEKEEL
jgi:HSP90 family molecular chaperone